MTLRCGVSRDHNIPGNVVWRRLRCVSGSTLDVSSSGVGGLAVAVAVGAASSERRSSTLEGPGGVCWLDGLLTSSHCQRPGSGLIRRKSKFHCRCFSSSTSRSCWRHSDMVSTCSMSDGRPNRHRLAVDAVAPPAADCRLADRSIFTAITAIRQSIHATLPVTLFQAFSCSYYSWHWQTAYDIDVTNHSPTVETGTQTRYSLQTLLSKPQPSTTHYNSHRPTTGTELTTARPPRRASEAAAGGRA